MLYQFEVDYAVDHQAMAAGEYRTFYASVLADDRVTADLTAAQMAYRHGIPCATRRVL